MQDECSLNLNSDQDISSCEYQNTTNSLPIQNDFSSNLDFYKDINNTNINKIDDTISLVPIQNECSLNLDSDQDIKNNFDDDMNKIKDIISFIDQGRDLKNGQNISLLLDSQVQNTTISLPIQNDMSSNKNSDKDINHTDKTKIEGIISIIHFVKDPRGLDDVSSLADISQDQKITNSLPIQIKFTCYLNLDKDMKDMKDIDTYFYFHFDYGKFIDQNLNISYWYITEIIKAFGNMTR